MQTKILVNNILPWGQDFTMVGKLEMSGISKKNHGVQVPVQTTRSGWEGVAELAVP